VTGLSTPTPTVTTGIQTTAAQSLAGTASPNQATGTSGLVVSSQPYSATTSPFTGTGVRIGEPSVSALSPTTSLSSPTVSGYALSQATRYDSSATPSSPMALIAGKVVATKCDVTTTLLTALEFERRISSLREDGNQSQVEGTRNQADLSTADGENID
jgi:hypothetical protein